jgi:hypothetical protein
MSKKVIVEVPDLPPPPEPEVTEVPPKETFKELCALSQQVFGKKYAWRKLTKVNGGMVIGTDKTQTYKYRRMRLTLDQVREYMLGLVKLQQQRAEQIVEQLEKNKTEGTDNV